MSRPPTHPTATGDRRGNEASHAACVLASTARRAGRSDLRIMGDLAAGKLKALARKVTTTTDPTGTIRNPHKLPMSEPRINLADACIRLRGAVTAAKRGDWAEAEDQARTALDVLEIGWIVNA